jgi:hypothetical protein
MIRFSIKYKEPLLEDRKQDLIKTQLRNELCRFIQTTEVNKQEVNFYLVPVTEVGSLSLAYYSYLLYQVFSKVITPEEKQACLHFLKIKYNNGLILSRSGLPSDTKELLAHLNVKYKVEDGNMSHLHDKYSSSMLYDLVLYKIINEYNRHKAVIEPTHIPRTYLGFLSFDLI